MTQFCTRASVCANNGEYLFFKFSRIPFLLWFSYSFYLAIVASGGPKGSPSAAPYSYWKEKETHQWIFSWLSWLAVLLLGAYAWPLRRRRSRATWRPYSKYNVDRDMQSWFTVYFFDIAHPCYDQLAPVKLSWPLTSIKWPYRRLKCAAHRGHVFFKLTADQVLVFY